MRQMNVTCPVCQQTHPDTHLKMLDYQTVQYVCPITSQKVNLLGYIPGATTFTASPNTDGIEDYFSDSPIDMVIYDTVLFVEDVKPSVTVWYSLLDDVNELMAISPGASVTTKTSLLTNPLTGDFTDTFIFKMNQENYSAYVNGTTESIPNPIGFKHRTYLDSELDTYIEVVVTQQGIMINLVQAGVVTDTVTLTGTFRPNQEYIFKMDVVNNVITVNIWTNGAMTPPSILSLNVPSMPAKTIYKVEYNYGVTGFVQPSNTGSGDQGYGKNPGYYLEIHYPAILLHNVTNTLAATPV